MIRTFDIISIFVIGSMIDDTLSGNNLVLNDPILTLHRFHFFHRVFQGTTRLHLITNISI